MAAIEKSVDVQVPARTAYDEWARFERFPDFMDDVVEVRRIDEVRLHWVAVIGGERREWDAEITEDEPGHRIAWRSTSGTRDNGSVEFTPTDDGTRVAVRMDREDEGTGAGTSAGTESTGDSTTESGENRVRRVLERFKHLIESRHRPSGRQREAPIGPEGYPEGTRLPALDLLRGMPVLDPEGIRVGTVQAVVVDSRLGFVRYLAVRTGWLVGRTHVVPVDEVTVLSDPNEAFLVVPYSTDVIKRSPALADEQELTPELERQVYAFYNRAGYWEAIRDAVRIRQTTPAPTPEIAEAEILEALAEAGDPEALRVTRWGG
jgi:sporulation protein YlmC with PRC-barrel domain